MAWPRMRSLPAAWVLLLLGGPRPALPAQPLGLRLEHARSQQLQQPFSQVPVRATHAVNDVTDMMEVEVLLIFNK
jgi:hypothetical protein